MIRVLYGEMKSKLKKCLVALAITPVILFAMFLVTDACFPLPISQTKPTQTVLAQDGTPLWRFADHAGIWRFPVSLNDVPDYYLEALLTYEDRNFYHHCGVDFRALLRAMYQNLTNNRIVSGGSTISMQVARILDPHERSIFGKFKQLFRTFQLEWHFSKDEILTLYINRAPYGGTIEGIGAASWAYLGKLPSQLTRSEAAMLAVLPQAPSHLRPDRYPQRAQRARDKVLNRLLTYHVWSPEVVEQVREDEVWVYPRRPPQLAPLLARRMSLAHPKDPIIRTTIDTSLQYTLEDTAINWKNQLPPKTSLAILVVDHTDMTVKGYVGSIDFNDHSRFGQIDMIKALRSPGSTLKPFLYGLAINEGMIHSESLLQDVPRIASDYRPTNFDEGFNGPVSVSESLQRSLNLPAVQIMELYGPKRFTSQLNAAGLSLHSSGNQPNISYILGGGSVRMDELVSAYSAFARNGKVSPLRFTADDPLTEKPLMSEGSAWVIRQIMAKQSVPMPNQKSQKVVPLAWKTGTSYSYRDAWAIGINARYLIGIWVGRPDGTPVVGQYGNAIAVPILQQVSTILLSKERGINRSLPTDPQPDSVTIADICWPTGAKLSRKDKNCHRQKRAWIVDDVIPPTLNQLNIMDNNYHSDTLAIWTNSKGLRVGADCSGAKEKNIALWPIALENWILPKEKRSALIPAMDSNCPVLGEGRLPSLFITGIMPNQVLQAVPGKSYFSIVLNSQGGVGKRWWFLDGKLVYETLDYLPLKFNFNSEDKGQHHLLLLDESGQIDRIKFRIQ